MEQQRDKDNRYLFSRRNMLTTLSVVGGAALLSSCSGESKPETTQSKTPFSIPEEPVNETTPSQEATSTRIIDHYKRTEYYTNLPDFKKSKLREFNDMYVDQFAELSLSERAVLGDSLYHAFKESLYDYILTNDDSRTPDSVSYLKGKQHESPEPVFDQYGTTSVHNMYNSAYVNNMTKIAIAMLMKREAGDDATEWMAEKLLLSTFTDVDSNSCATYRQELAYVDEFSDKIEIIKKYFPPYTSIRNRRLEQVSVADKDIFEGICVYSNPNVGDPTEFKYQYGKQLDISGDEINYWTIDLDYVRDGIPVDY